MAFEPKEPRLRLSLWQSLRRLVGRVPHRIQRVSLLRRETRRLASQRRIRPVIHSCAATSSTCITSAPRAQGNFAFTAAAISPEPTISAVPAMR